MTLENIAVLAAKAAHELRLRHLLGALEGAVSNAQFLKQELELEDTREDRMLQRALDEIESVLEEATDVVFERLDEIRAE